MTVGLSHETVLCLRGPDTDPAVPRPAEVWLEWRTGPHLLRTPSDRAGHCAHCQTSRLTLVLCQINVHVVKVTWHNVLQHRECADWMEVEWWRSGGGQTVMRSGKKAKTTHLVTGLSEGVNYTLRVGEMTGNVGECFYMKL